MGDQDVLMVGARLEALSFTPTECRAGIGVLGRYLALTV